MDINIKALVLSAVSKDYKFDGKEGVSHKVRLMVNGEIYICNSNEEQVKSLSSYVNKEVGVFLKVVSPRENLGLKIVSFKA